MNKKIVFLVSVLSVFALILATGAAFANGNTVLGHHYVGEDNRCEEGYVNENAINNEEWFPGPCPPPDNGNGNNGNGEGDHRIPPPSVVQLPSGCYKDPEGKWILVGMAYGADGQLLETVAGNEWHVLVQSWKTDGGPIVGDLGTWDFPLFPDGSFGNGFLPEQNFEHQVTLVRMINGQIVETYEALMLQINKETGEILPPGYQPNLIGGYCGDTYVRVDILP